MDSQKDDSINNESSSGEESNRINENNRNLTTTSVGSNDQLFDTTCNEQNQHRSKTNTSDSIANINNNEENSDEDELDVNFLTHAERTLNKVYGKAWKTPEVIRTLKRTSRTPKKTNSTQSPQSSVNLSSFRETKSKSPNMVKTRVGSKLDQSVVESTLDDFSICT